MSGTQRPGSRGRFSTCVMEPGSLIMERRMLPGVQRRARPTCPAPNTTCRPPSLMDAIPARVQIRVYCSHFFIPLLGGPAQKAVHKSGALHVAEIIGRHLPGSGATPLRIRTFLFGWEIDTQIN
jgi:hypothetical protein